MSIAIPSTVVMKEEAPTCCCGYKIPKGDTVEVIELHNARKKIYLIKASTGYHLVKEKYLR